MQQRPSFCSQGNRQGRLTDTGRSGLSPGSPVSAGGRGGWGEAARAVVAGATACALGTRSPVVAP